MDIESYLAERERTLIKKLSSLKQQHMVVGKQVDSLAGALQEVKSLLLVLRTESE